MKTKHQIALARKKLRELFTTPGLSDAQSVMLAGMANALAWVADSPNGSTLDRLLAGETLAAGKDPTAGLRILRDIAKNFGASHHN